MKEDPFSFCDGRENVNERTYQAKLIRRIREMFPGCIILKNDSAYLQGVPDILVLYNCNWAMLEVKASDESDVQPNQQYYVELLDNMSFASFINPQNEEDVLHDLQHTFRSLR
jgi:hypothetical protein